MFSTVLLGFSELARAAETGGSWFPPPHELFHPLIADRRETQTHALYLRDVKGAHRGEVAVGKDLGLWRKNSKKPGGFQIQLNLAGSIFSRFIIGQGENQLTSVDFFVGAPLEMRCGFFSGRLTLYHTSAHLGDDFIQRTGRIKFRFSRESGQFLLACEPAGWLRLYAGPTYAIRRAPVVERGLVQVGLELTSPQFRKNPGWIEAYLAQDLQWKEEVAWGPNYSLQGGVSLGGRGSRNRVRIGLGYFSGHSLQGQFFKEKEEHVSLGFFFDY